MENDLEMVFFCDLPVYRLSEPEYEKWQDNRYRQDTADLRSAEAQGFTIPLTTYTFFQERLRERYGPWQFNEILGYIRLHFLGSRLRGQYFSAEKARNPVSRHKVFTCRSVNLSSEMGISKTASNEEIYATIREYIKNCRGELRAGRVIDAAQLMALGPHVDWRGLVNGSD